MPMPCGAAMSVLLGLKRKFWTHGNNPRISFNGIIEHTKLQIQVAFQHA
jgi:hypothetical protein